MLPLFRSEFCVQHEIGHPDDTVHRRPDLVTHIHQELVLCPVCGLGAPFARCSSASALLRSVTSFTTPKILTGSPRASRSTRPCALIQCRDMSGQRIRSEE